MATKDQISQRFEKWDNKNWLNIEKQINTFQKKVAQNMLALGSFDYNPQDIKPCLDDQCVLGQQIYTQIVRPKLVKLQFLPKEKKQKQKDKKKKKVDDSDQDSDIEEQKEIVKQTVANKKAGKKQKPKKAPKVKKEDVMKQKIVRQNFAKQIEFVFQSFSMDKLQIEFGFRQKKLELKMATFFYIACYIRKNKVKLQMDQSQVFELINILIKAHRIFKNYQGKSFLDSAAVIQISTKFITDLKDCLDGLMQYYSYSIKQVIHKYPKLVYYTIYDQYFPTLDIKPYKSQIQFAQSVRNALTSNKSTLIFYKTMIGSGKTSASISIANMIRQLKMLDDQKYKYLQLIYCCIIKSVRSQVGKLAYNEKLKFALGTMDTVRNPKNVKLSQTFNKSTLDSQLAKVKSQSEYFPRIVNSFSCISQKVVDLIISDLYTTKQFFCDNKLPKLISQNLRQEGKLERENIVLFLDEPTAFCSQTSTVTKKLFQIISQYPPKIIIFASATMPQQQQLQRMISLIKIKNPDLQVKQIQSKQFQIGCQFCTFDGDIIYPHSNVKTKEKLIQIIQLIQKNPFLMRLYTGPSLFTLLDKCKSAGLKKGLPKLQNFLQIRQTDILRQTLNILNQLKNQSQQIIEEACKVDNQLMNIGYQQKGDQDQIQIDKDKKKEKYVNLKRLLKGDAYKFLGGCLIATQDPITFAKTIFEQWIEDIPPIKKLLDRYEKDHRILYEKLEAIQEDKNMRAQQKIKRKTDVANQFEPKFDFPDIKRINTSAHYAKYCKNKNPIHNSMLIKPIIVENIGIHLFSQVEDWMIKLLFCGVAVYSKSQQSSVYLNKVQQLASSNFVSYIICDQSLCYGTNFPISNVILRDDLAQYLSMNEMFQLIGRAGRVGQSWTARAFLQKKGVRMLQDYIWNYESNKLSPEGEIFEKFASQILQNPALQIKSQKFQIKYTESIYNNTEINNGKAIQIKIRNNVQKQKQHSIKQIVGIIYRTGQNGFQLYSGSFSVYKDQKQSWKDLEVYKVFSGTLLQIDLPRKTIINSLGQQKSIFNLQLFYKDDQKFIIQTLNNAIRRIVKQQFEGKVQITKINNEFNLTNYRDYFLNNQQKVQKQLPSSLFKNQSRYIFFLQSNIKQQSISKTQRLVYKFNCIVEQKGETQKQQYATQTILRLALQLEQANEDFFRSLLENPKKALQQYTLQPINKGLEDLLKNISYKNLYENNLRKLKGICVNELHEKYLAILQNFDFLYIQKKNFKIDYRIRQIWGRIEQIAKNLK